MWPDIQLSPLKGKGIIAIDNPFGRAKVTAKLKKRRQVHYE
jgi:hypothetical protein